MALTKVWNREQFTLPRLVYNDTPAMNELVAESCAVVSSISCTIMAERTVRLRDTMTKKDDKDAGGLESGYCEEEFQEQRI